MSVVTYLFQLHLFWAEQELTLVYFCVHFSSFLKK